MTNKQIKKDILSMKEVSTVGTSGSDKVNVKVSSSPGSHLRRYNQFIGGEDISPLLKTKFLKVNGKEIY